MKVLNNQYIIKHFPVAALAVLLVIFLAAIGNGSDNKNFVKKIAPQAVQGVIDLSDWNLREDGLVAIDGEWEFYWKRLLTPADFANDLSGAKSLVVVPNQWNNYAASDDVQGGAGYATYRLTLKLQQPHMKLGLKLPDVSTSYNIWIDGKFLDSTGVVGSNAELCWPAYQPKVLYFENFGNTAEVVIQVANFVHHKGGLKSSLQFGTDKEIRQLREKKLALDVFLFGVFLIMACYHFGLFCLRRKEKSTLYFGLFCLLVAIRTTVTGEILVVEVLPNIDWQLILKVEYLTYYLGLPTFLGFIYYLFPQETSIRVLKTVNVIGIAFGMVVLLLPLKVFAYTLMFYNFLTVAASVHMLYAMYKAASANKEGAFLFSLGIGVIAVSAVNDMLYNNNLINTGNIVPTGLFIFIFIQSFVLSARFSYAMSAVEQMSDKLRKSHVEIAGWNKKLEKTVDQRTAAVRNLLNNAGQGFLTFGYDLLIRGEYSNECVKLFEQDIKNKNFAKLLFPNNDQEQSFTTEALQQVLDEEDAAMQKIYLSLLPEEALINDKNVKIEYKVLGSDKNDQVLMVILTDITEKRLIERQMEQERLILKMVVRVIQSRRDFINCIKEYRQFCHEGLKSIIESDLETDEMIFEVFRKTHTFKGIFSQFGMGNITESLNVMETELSALGKNSVTPMTVKELIEFLDGFDMLTWLDKDIVILKEVIGEDVLLDENGVVISHSQLAEFERKVSELIQQPERAKLLAEISKLKFVLFRDLFKRYPDLTLQLAEKEGKFINPFVISGGRFPVDADQYYDLAKSVIHLFINSVNHGIESVEERLAYGKNQYGEITCSIELSDGKIAVVITDDGSGIDFNKVREKVVSKGLYSPEQAAVLTEAELLKFIFEARFSTRDDITMLSGCGVGMAVVKREAEKLGGTISITTEAGQGTAYIITIPYHER